jgi:hypothetical protein
MANIVIRCPVSQQVVPTGLTTGMIVLDDMNITVVLKQNDAWVDGMPPRV